MRLRKECEHGRWEAHSIEKSGFFKLGDCPGGEFLPEGALVIEKDGLEAFRSLRWLAENMLWEWSDRTQSTESAVSFGDYLREGLIERTPYQEQSKPEPEEVFNLSGYSVERISELVVRGFLAHFDDWLPADKALDALASQVREVCPCGVGHYLDQHPSQVGESE